MFNLSVKFSLTSAKVPDPGSTFGTCGQDPAPSPEPLSNSSHSSKLHSQGTSEGFPSGEEQTSPIPSLGGDFWLPASKIPHLAKTKGAFFEVTTRCRAELTALTSCAGFEWSFKPVRGTSCYQTKTTLVLASTQIFPLLYPGFPWKLQPLSTGIPPGDAAGSWGVLRTGPNQALNVTIAPTCPQKWICEHCKRNQALPIRSLLEIGAVRWGRSFHKQETAAQSCPCTQQCWGFFSHSHRQWARLPLTLCLWIYILGQKSV